MVATTLCLSNYDLLHTRCVFIDQELIRGIEQLRDFYPCTWSWHDPATLSDRSKRRGMDAWYIEVWDVIVYRQTAGRHFVWIEGRHFRGISGKCVKEFLSQTRSISKRRGGSVTYDTRVKVWYYPLERVAVMTTVFLGNIFNNVVTRWPVRSQIDRFHSSMRFFSNSLRDSISWKEEYNRRFRSKFWQMIITNHEPSKSRSSLTSEF